MKPDPTSPFAQAHNPNTGFSYTPQFMPKHPLPPYILGGTINLLVGSHQSGKTPMLGRLIRDWMSGKVLGQEIPNGSVTEHALLMTNRSWQHAAQFSVEFKDLPLPLKTYAIVDDATFDLTLFRTKTARVELFAACVDRLHLQRGALLWVDPFTLFLGSNLLDFDACAVNCLEIHKVLAARGITMIGTGMTAKPRHEDVPHARLLDRIFGTASQLAFVDTCFYLATPDELERPRIYTLQVYPQHAPMLSLDFIRREDGTFADAPPDAEFAPILALLQPGVVTPARQLADALVPAQMSRPALYKCLRALVELGRVQKVSHGKYTLPQVAEAWTPPGN